MEKKTPITSAGVVQVVAGIGFVAGKTGGGHCAVKVVCTCNRQLGAVGAQGNPFTS